MKNLILSCAVACVATFACINQARAQETKTRFGIKAGADLMTLGKSTDATTGQSVNYDYRVGFQGGIYGVTPLSSTIDFMPQVLFTQKGGNAKASVTVAGTTFNISDKSEIDYLDIPLLVGFKVQPNLTFTLGPQIAFLLSQKTTLNLTGGSNSQSTSSTDTQGLKKTVIGGNLGASYLINNNVGINLNYMIDLQRTGDKSLNPDATERNSGFALSVSYLF